MLSLTQKIDGVSATKIPKIKFVSSSTKKYAKSPLTLAIFVRKSELKSRKFWVKPLAILEITLGKFVAKKCGFLSDIASSVKE